MTTIVDTLAEAQNRLYALANRLPDAADRIEVMAIHSLVGMGVYDAMPKETTAARAMLATLKAWLAASPYGDPQAYNDIVRKAAEAVAQAEAAGIGEK